ncbi:hypothetical protein HCP62_001448 [Salmonella enterica subsp. diarizonae]|nr:hypothetical protein [Salmonella enterica subsp. diarizonae]EGV3635115.1 hypothetical protein [Salmonella enterica]
MMADDVFPAPAGINRLSQCSGIAPSGVPRASGDKPAKTDWKKLEQECSPRQRG